MCPPSSVPPRADIGVYWTDEEIFASLERLLGGSFSLENVLTDVNPYQLRPSNLPEGIWYFMQTEQGKNSEHGSWNARGEANQIFRNSTITGWRTTLEFYEGQAPTQQRTNWVMQEYRINYNGLRSNGNSKVSGLLCRVFLSGPNPEFLGKLEGLENSERSRYHPRSSALLIQEPGSTTGQGSRSESQVRATDDNMRLLAGNGEHVNIPFEDMLYMDDIARGDFLELDDLADVLSQSSSSDNTSCVTCSSEERFDDLLQDLEDELNRQQQVQDSNINLSVAASARPTDVVMRPANLGSLISSNGRHPPAGDTDKKVQEKVDLKNVAKIQKVENRNEGTSNPCNVASSSSSHKGVPEGERDARVIRMKKLRKKYLCFMPF